jgi:phage shock protein A
MNMALLERVSTLIRANLNDLVDKAEDPEKMIKQVILDMENQLLQVKTQVAIAIADQHVLVKKQQENDENERTWMKRAELALDKGEESLARSALERSLSYKNMTESFRQQVEDQKTQVENLKTALLKLQQKLAEAQSKSDLLIARHRRSRAMNKATQAGMNIGEENHSSAFNRMNNKVRHAEAEAEAQADLAADNVDDRFALMEKQEVIDQLLADLKARRKAG